MTMFALVLAATLQLPPQKSDAVIGVSALHLESGRRVSVRGGERFPMGSVYKFPIGLTLLEFVENDVYSLDEKVTIEPDDFSPGWSPLRDAANGKPVTRTLRELLELTVSVSDNTASDYLLVRMTPPLVRARLAVLGIVDGIRIDRTERAIARELDARGGREKYVVDARDTATPDAMLRLLELFWRNEEGLTPEHHALLVDLMTKTTTGARRIKSAIPAGASLAHKTGTMPGTVNDVGVITTPDGQHIAVAIFTKARKKSSEKDAEDDIAAVARAVYEQLTR